MLLLYRITSPLFNSIPLGGEPESKNPVYFSLGSISAQLNFLTKMSQL